MLPIETMIEQIAKHFNYSTEKVKRIVDFYKRTNKIQDLNDFVEMLMDLNRWRKTV